MNTEDSRTLTLENAILQYEKSMDEANIIAYNIAKNQLESSFDIEKSIGFMEYIQENNIKIQQNSS